MLPDGLGRRNARWGRFWLSKMPIFLKLVKDSTLAVSIAVLGSSPLAKEENASKSQNIFKNKRMGGILWHQKMPNCRFGASPVWQHFQLVACVLEQLPLPQAVGGT